MPSAERPLTSLSVLVPTWQGEEFLERLLDALAIQRTRLAWDVWFVDSGSTDGTLAILARRARGFPAPLEVRHIHQSEFDHGDTRNLLAALSSGELLVFLTQDAIPVGDDWLERVVRNFDDPRVAAVTCRNVPRPDAHPVTKVLSAADPGYASERRETRLPEPAVYDAMAPHERRVLYNFNDVASALRREVWEFAPFPRTWFGEDVLMARALLEAGWTVVYDADARVEHSHDYTPAEAYARAYVDGRFNAEWLGWVAIASERDANALCRRCADEDGAAIRAAGFHGDEARAHERFAAALRRATFTGLLAGGDSERRRAPTGVLTKRALKVLFVVHGFPPDTWAGTEVYTFNLARELRRRGHEVAVFARVPATGDTADFTVTEAEFQGLRVLRMTSALAHRNLRESYENPRAEAAFREALLAERPDVVHFQHLIHTSIGLVEIAREAGCATVVHCHDYWAVCPRVQMIRPDGVRCDQGQGAGCYLCVKERSFGMIGTLKRAGEACGPILAELADLVGKPDFRDLSERTSRVTAAYAACDLQVSPSRFLRDVLLGSGAFEPHRFLFSDNGMRTDHVDALAKTPRPRDDAGRAVVRFGFVGSLVWYKGGETMIRAFARLAKVDAPVELHVHGAFDPELDEHHAQLARLAAESGARVEFHGRFDNARLGEVYAGLDVLIVPSVWFENSPITIHEAWMTRTPVVASGIGGMAEYVRDGVDGLTFAPGDDADLARVLRRFTVDPELVERLSRDFPRVKTIAEDAAATEFRYRGLLATRRSRRSATLLDAPGAAARSVGPVERQGADLVLLRPGGAAIEYDVPAAGPERGASVRVDVLALGGEAGVELGGRVLWNGAELGGIAPFRAGSADELKSFTYPLPPADLAAGRLRIESALAAGGPEAFLRVARVVVREAGGAEAHC